jgi:hypothetical protein
VALDPSLDHCVFVLLFPKIQEMAVRQRIEANPYDTEAWTELAQEAQVPIFWCQALVALLGDNSAMGVILLGVFFCSDF